MTIPPLLPPIVHPPACDWPVLLSVPHAGRDYPEWLISMAQRGRRSLETLEDPWVDALAEPAVEAGFGAVIARTPRAAIDCNRAEDDIDPTVVRTGPIAALSVRARGGLGIVPGRTAAYGPLWRWPIGLGELEHRLEQAHRPYHRAIEDRLAELCFRFGCAILIDCHSMPTQKGAAPVVLGDRHGRSAAPWVTSEAVRLAAGMGLAVGVNDPFAGGYVLQRHARPNDGVHAIQIEIDRRLYLDGSGLPNGAARELCARMILTLAEGLGRALLDRRFAAAAE